MGTEETKSTSDTTNSITENNVTTTQKVAYGEEKIKEDEEEEISSREKKPVDVSTTSAAPDLKIEEEKNVIVDCAVCIGNIFVRRHCKCSSEW